MLQVPMDKRSIGAHQRGDCPRAPEQKVSVKSYLDPVEIARLEGAACNSRDRLLIRLLSHLGCRVSEALALAVEDADLQAGTVTIQHLKQRIKLLCPKCGMRLGRAHRFCPGCGAGVEEAVARQTEHRRMRVLPVDQATMQMLRQFIESGGPALRGERRPLFHINRHRSWQVVKECAERAGLGELMNSDTGRVRGVSPHRLRDAFAVHAMKLDDSGEGMRLLQEHLGHASFNTTARYRKVAGEEHRRWYDSLWPEVDRGGESAAGSGRDLPGDAQR